MATQDVGNGVQLVDFNKSLGDPIDSQQKLLSLVDLANRIQQAPAERRIKEAEATLKSNQVTQIDTENAIREQQLHSAENEERRKQVTFSNDQLLHIREGFQQSFTAGSLMAKRAGADSVDNGDGSYSVLFPGQPAFQIWPHGITDPVKLNEVPAAGSV